MTTPYGPASLVDEVHDWLTQATALQGSVRIADLDLAPNVDPPAAIVGPPIAEPRTPGSDGGGPVRYRLTVWVVVGESDRAFRDLLEHTEAVVRVLDEPAGITIVEWRPTTFPVGQTELPAYAIDLEVTA